MEEKIIILDYGSQYTHLLARRIRELNVFSDIMPADTSAEELKDAKGIILSGGPASVYGSDSPKIDTEIFNLGIPILGLCYGHQLIAFNLDGEVKRGEVKEYGLAKLRPKTDSLLFKGLEDEEIVWMSHGDTVSVLPKGFENIGSTEDCPIAAMQNTDARLFGLQFHPEVTHTKNGMKILKNFTYDICECEGLWDYEHYIKDIENDILNTVKDRNVFLLVSGGVDSTVCFTLLNKMLGKERVIGLHIDNGLMRKDESRKVYESLKELGYDNLHIVDASDKFLTALESVYEPEKKRKIIGDMFITVQKEELEKMNLDPEKWVLGQGTIYPDTIETGGTKNADTIKTHHNRVEIIEKLIHEGKVVEPLKNLYKDEVRYLGEKLGIPHELVWRHPFPGPGLGVRILCSETESDSFIESEKVKSIAQSFGYDISVLPVKSVGVQGDGRTYRHPAIVTGDYDWEKMQDLSVRITNESEDVNRVALLCYPARLETVRLKNGYITKDRVRLLQDADDIVNTIIEEAGLYENIWQMPIALLPLGLNGGESIVLRPVVSKEAMTADVFQLPKDVLDKIIDTLSNIEGIDAVFYDITNKPPGTIEWE